MDLPLEQQTGKAHADSEHVEGAARAIQDRIIAFGGIQPSRPSGKPIDPASVKLNLTLASLPQRKDPKLAAFFGDGSDYQRSYFRSAGSPGFSSPQSIQRVGLSPDTGLLRSRW